MCSPLVCNSKINSLSQGMARTPKPIGMPPSPMPEDLICDESSEEFIEELTSRKPEPGSPSSPESPSTPISTSSETDTDMSDNETKDEEKKEQKEQKEDLATASASWRVMRWFLGSKTMTFQVNPIINKRGKISGDDCARVVLNLFTDQGKRRREQLWARLSQSRGYNGITHDDLYQVICFMADWALASGEANLSSRYGRFLGGAFGSGDALGISGRRDWTPEQISVHIVLQAIDMLLMLLSVPEFVDIDRAGLPLVAFVCLGAQLEGDDDYYCPFHKDSADPKRGSVPMFFNHCLAPIRCTWKREIRKAYIDVFGKVFACILPGQTIVGKDMPFPATDATQWMNPKLVIGQLPITYYSLADHESDKRKRELEEEAEERKKKPSERKKEKDPVRKPGGPMVMHNDFIGMHELKAQPILCGDSVYRDEETRVGKAIFGRRMIVPQLDAKGQCIPATRPGKQWKQHVVLNPEVYRVLFDSYSERRKFIAKF